MWFGESVVGCGSVGLGEGSAWVRREDVVGVCFFGIKVDFVDGICGLGI